MVQTWYIYRPNIQQPHARQTVPMIEIVSIADPHISWALTKLTMNMRHTQIRAAACCIFFIEIAEPDCASDFVFYEPHKYLVLCLQCLAQI